MAPEPATPNSDTGKAASRLLPSLPPGANDKPETSDAL
jgi:hypothetical protein